MIDDIDELVGVAQEFAERTELPTEVGVAAVPLEVFDLLHEREGGKLLFAKCACGSCGNIVVSFDYLDGDVTVHLSRSATEDETVTILERMLDG